MADTSAKYTDEYRRETIGYRISGEAAEASFDRTKTMEDAIAMAA